MGEAAPPCLAFASKLYNRIQGCFQSFCLAEQIQLRAGEGALMVSTLGASERAPAVGARNLDLASK